MLTSLFNQGWNLSRCWKGALSVSLEAVRYTCYKEWPRVWPRRRDLGKLESQGKTEKSNASRNEELSWQQNAIAFTKTTEVRCFTPSRYRDNFVDVKPGMWRLAGTYTAGCKLPGRCLASRHFGGVSQWRPDAARQRPECTSSLRFAGCVTVAVGLAQKKRETPCSRTKKEEKNQSQGKGEEIFRKQTAARSTRFPYRRHGLKEVREEGSCFFCGWAC